MSDNTGKAEYSGAAITEEANDTSGFSSKTGRKETRSKEALSFISSNDHEEVLGVVRRNMRREINTDAVCVS